MWVPLFTGVAAAFGLIVLLPKGEVRARNPTAEAGGTAAETDLSSDRPAQTPPLPPGAVDLDEYRARKASIRNSVDVLVLLSILFVAAYVIHADYGWQPITLLLENFPREARVMTDVWQGIGQVKGDVLQWIQKTRYYYGV